MRQAAHQRELENLAEKKRRMSVYYIYGKRSQMFAICKCGLDGRVFLYNRSYRHRERQQSTAAAAVVQVLELCTELFFLLC